MRGLKYSCMRNARFEGAPVWTITIPQSSMNRLAKRAKCEKRVELAFSRAKAWLTLVGSKTLDSIHDIFIPKQGLVNATADEFAEQKGININNEDIRQAFDPNKNIMNGDKHKKHNKLRHLGENLGNGFSHRVQLVVVHQNKTNKIYTKAVKIYL